ncbi:hypothetical protein M408DRAFT_327011 [Serendipita vermifera MAFF 305830]|uniref:Uncharacterized protein n=1 Tax=Serendipita vermifera MAFF 305830 TaxID=933852 RepID=A0A0C2XU80_SERVB|nr:hypothetical protein M408DRAFT_327011 [Serendipita vermifera MAFF 305830]
MAPTLAIESARRAKMKRIVMLVFGMYAKGCDLEWNVRFESKGKEKKKKKKKSLRRRKR